MRRWAAHLGDVLLILGAICIPAAVWLVHPPAALAVLGLELLGFGLLLTLTVGRR